MSLDVGELETHSICLHSILQGMHFISMHLTALDRSAPQGTTTLPQEPSCTRIGLITGPNRNPDLKTKGKNPTKGMAATHNNGK
jgi:hypothetical protein